MPTYVGEFLLGRYCATTDPDELLLPDAHRGRRRFTLDQWRQLLLHSVGFEPARLSSREQDVLIARILPFVVANYNAVELGPRGTGRSHLLQQVSPYAHLVSGGKATIANMFVNNATGRRASSRSTTSSASTRCPACRSTRRTA